VDDRARVTLSACIGAAAGGLVGFLLFTDRGRRVREDFGAQLASIGEEFGRVNGAVDSLRAAAGSGWGRLSSLVADLLRSAAAPVDLADEEEAGPAPRFH
jgi:hypothetical protein